MTEIKIKILSGISFIDEAFDSTLTGNYHLSIQLGLDGFCFCILDTKTNKYLVLETYSFQGAYSCSLLCEGIEVLVNQNKILKNNFKSVSAALVNNKFTLVPNPLFEAENKNTYLGFSHSLEEDEDVIVESLKNLDVKILFALPHCLKNTLKVFFSNLSIHNYSSSLLEGLLLHYKNQSTKKVFVHVQISHFEIVVLDGKNLIFYNSFNHQTSEDFIYYLLFVCEQLKLNPENLELILLGEVERNSAIYSILHKYIRHIKFGERNESFEYSYKLNDLPKHFYYNLFSQYLCV